MTNEENVFNEMENQSVMTEEKAQIIEKQMENRSNDGLPGEVNYEELSNTPVGDKKKYIRENLDNQVIVIGSAKLFNADVANEEPSSGWNDPNVKYYTCNFILEYDKENPEGMKNREYISGVKQFVQKDNSLSEHQFWYEGSGTQAAKIWELVAKLKGVEPKDLSIKVFLATLNSGVKARIKYTDVEFRKKITKKNLPVEFLN